MESDREPGNQIFLDCRKMGGTVWVFVIQSLEFLQKRKEGQWSRCGEEKQ